MRNKLQSSGRKAIMVGYLRERKAYRLFDIERKSIVEERNVIFIENQRMGITLKKKKKMNILIGILNTFLIHLTM